MPLGIDVLGTIPKGIIKIKRMKDLEIREQVEIISTTELLRLARILRRVLETWEDMLSLKSQWKAIA